MPSMTAAWLASILTALSASLFASDAAKAVEFDPWTQTARYEFEYRVNLGSLPAGHDKRIWIPTPADTPSQKLLSTEVESPWPYRVTGDSYGNRTLFASHSGEAGERAGELVARFVVERRPSAGVPATASTTRPGGHLDPQRFLNAQRKIPLEGIIADIAARESRGLETDSEIIRAFYDYVIRNMTYAKHGEGWGQGDAIWACTEKYGNCTDFHSLFIGMARSQGIPARFIIGFPISPSQASGDVSGYHCWAEVYQADRGWFPLDASEAKKSSRIESYYGNLPSDRIEFSVGRDLILSPPQQGEPANYFIYPYVEIDGKLIEEIPAKFRYIRIPSGKVERSANDGTAETQAPS